MGGGEEKGPRREGEQTDCFRVCVRGRKMLLRKSTNVIFAARIANA